MLQIDFSQRRRIRSGLGGRYPFRGFDELYALPAQTCRLGVFPTITFDRVLAPRPFAEGDSDIAALMGLFDDKILQTRRTMPFTLTCLRRGDPFRTRGIQMLPERAVRRDGIHLPIERAACAQFVEQVDETLAELAQSVLALRQRHTRDALVVERPETRRIERLGHHRVARRIDRQSL